MRSLILLTLASCTSNKSDDTATDDSTVPETPPTLCETLGLSERPFDAEGPYGERRGDLADDFTIDLIGGAEPWTLSEHWSGCDVVVFVPHYLSISDLDRDSVWTQGVSELVERSPRNARYVFVSVDVSESTAASNAEEMQERIDESLAVMSDEDAAWWADRLLVADASSSDLGNWVEDIFDSNVGAYGFVIDRRQRVRGLGYLASVEGYNSRLQQNGSWPFELRLFSAASEVAFHNYQAALQDRLDAEDATIVQPLGGDVVAQYVDFDAALPDAAAMEGFDTLEIDVLMECPDTDGVEFNNCGAWDYLAHLWLQNPEDESWMEMGRFITTYHRESRWVVDASHALAWLQEGGTRRMRYEWAPSWNTQPTGVTLQLRFTNQGKPGRPQQAIRLFTGGSFNSAYNDGRTPVEVEIPADATHVELRAITTGHGGETRNCAEFCAHQHRYTINEQTFAQEFPEAGVDTACADTVGTGTTPNQAGTWWFGRGGWCPGRQVDPFIVDLTELATPGSTITASYRGLLNDLDPPDNAGNILHNSWLVISR